MRVRWTPAPFVGLGANPFVDAPSGASAPENEEYDPASDSWASRADMPTPRHGLGVVAVGGRVFALSGGPHPGGTYSNVNEAYAPPR